MRPLGLGNGGFDRFFRECEVLRDPGGMAVVHANSRVCHVGRGFAGDGMGLDFPRPRCAGALARFSLLKGADVVGVQGMDGLCTEPSGTRGTAFSESFRGRGKKRSGWFLRRSCPGCGDWLVRRFPRAGALEWGTRVPWVGSVRREIGETAVQKPRSGRGRTVSLIRAGRRFLRNGRFGRGSSGPVHG